jgi:hypothetical protein
MPEQCIGLPFSLEDLGCSRGEWEALSLRLQPPGTHDFDESVLSETLSRGDPKISAAALLFASEFERYKGRDHRILDRLFKAVEILPENIATLTAVVDELEGFHRPSDALPFAERLAHIAKEQQSTNPGRKRDLERWILGKIKYLAGGKAEAIAYWRTLPFYQRPDGEGLLTLYIEGCERRLAQYAEHERNRASSS